MPSNYELPDELLVETLEALVFLTDTPEELVDESEDLRELQPNDYNNLLERIRRDRAGLKKMDFIYMFENRRILTLPYEQAELDDIWTQAITYTQHSGRCALFPNQQLIRVLTSFSDAVFTIYGWVMTMVYSYSMPHSL